jgi:proline dehydrogenase
MYNAPTAPDPDGRFPDRALERDERRIQFACQRAEIGFQEPTRIPNALRIRGDSVAPLARVASGPSAPYGVQWYPYFVRRLAERPANLWFFLSNLFRR